MKQPRLILTKDQKNNLKKLFDSYVSHGTSSEAKNVLNSWESYREKIVNDSLSLDDYTNTTISTSKDDKVQHDYLCNFLERHSKVFGSSRPGSSHQYMVHINVKETKKNTDKNKVVYYVKNQEGYVEENASKEDAEKVFNAWLKPLLKDVVDANSYDKIFKLENDNKYRKYEAKQILQKMVVLNNADKAELKFVHIYQKESIDSLYKMFFGNSEEKIFF